MKRDKFITLMNIREVESLLKEGALDPIDKLLAQARQAEILKSMYLNMAAVPVTLAALIAVAGAIWEIQYWEVGFSFSVVVYYIFDWLSMKWRRRYDKANYALDAASLEITLRLERFELYARRCGIRLPDGWQEQLRPIDEEE